LYDHIGNIRIATRAVEKTHHFCRGRKTSPVPEKRGKIDYLRKKYRKNSSSPPSSKKASVKLETNG
jgi:hypothetical protein